MITSTLKGRVRGAQDREMPLEQVVLRVAAQNWVIQRYVLSGVSGHHPTPLPAGHRYIYTARDQPPKQAGGGDAHLERSRAVLWRRVLEFFSLFQ